jgi:ribonuclease BN (tRNA processing enzyme)
MSTPSIRCALLALVAAISAPAARAQAGPQRVPAAGRDSTTLVLLGTGMPRPDPSASGPATAVVVGSRVFLFDAGPGVMRRVAAAHLPINGPTALFFTHLHTDHTLGYPDVIFTTWVMGRRRPLEAYGPHGLAAMTQHILAAWSEDEDIRTNGLEHEAPNGYAVHVHEISPGVVYDSGGVRITAIPVLHGSWKEAYGYRIDTPTRSIVLSGDTRYAPSVEDAARGVDVLVHEVYAGAHVTPEQRAGGSDWPTYMHDFHTSDAELGRLAAAAKPKMLVLIHIVGNPAWNDEIVKTIRAAGYAGQIVIGKDLERF